MHHVKIFFALAGVNIRNFLKVMMGDSEKAQVFIKLFQLADGSQLAPDVVFKQKTLPKSDKFLKNTVQCQDKMSIDGALVPEWIKFVRCRWPGALLVLDAFCWHLADSLKKLLRECRTQLAIISKGVISQL